jgi:hypothetical protein
VEDGDEEGDDDAGGAGTEVVAGVEPPPLPQPARTVMANRATTDLRTVVDGVSAAMI